MPPLLPFICKSKTVPAANSDDEDVDIFTVELELDDGLFSLLSDVLLTDVLLSLVVLFSLLSDVLLWLDVVNSASVELSDEDDEPLDVDRAAVELLELLLLDWLDVESA